MGVGLLEIGVKMGKGVIFTVRGCFRSVCNHPFLVGMLCFLIFLYRSSPFIFQLLVSTSPILVCTAILLGTLLSFGQPNIPEIEIEEKTSVEAASIKTGVLGDSTFVEENESHYVERFSENRWDGAEKSIELPELLSGKLGEVRREEDSDDTAPLIEESEVSNGEKRGADRELRFEEKTEWIEERLNNLSLGESHHSSDTKENGELIESDDDDDEKSEADSFGSEKVNVDSLDSPPRSPWARVVGREDGDEEKEAEAGSENEQDEDDEASDSESDRAESSSPDASMADIMPMLDELHPLLDEDAPQTAHLSRGSSDAASEKSLKSSAGSHESDNESENHDDLEGADDENDDGEDEEDAQGEKDEETKSAITWTEEDQKNLMDLGSSEIERNLRLENLILRRRARKNTSLLAERNLIDFESSDLPFNIAPISTRRQNPFDLPLEYYDNSGLHPIPGSAPSVLLPRRNPFDIPYDSSEEKPDLKGDGFQEEFTSQSREPFFRRHESFNMGPSIFAPKKQDVKMRPYFVPERTISEESSSSLFRRQSSELSDSKVSSIPETESLTSVEDLEDKKLPENDCLPEGEVVEWTKEVTEEGPSGNPELIFRQEIETELIFRQEIETKEDVHREPEMFFKVESASKHIGHGSESSEEEDSLELGEDGKRDLQIGESQSEDVRDLYEQGSAPQYVEGQGFTHGSDSETVEPRYTRVSSSSSLSEVSERVSVDTEGEGLSMLEDRSDHGDEEPTISTQTSLESTDLNTTSTLVNNISMRGPVYDSSPRGLNKNVSSSSIVSDVLPQFDLGFAPVLDKITTSSIGSEGNSREIETDIPRNIEMLHDSSTSYPVSDECRPVDVVDIREHDNVNSHFSGVDQRTMNEGSSAAASSPPHMFLPLRSSSEALMEESLMEKHIFDEVSVSIADKNIHTVVRSSKDQDTEQAEEKHLLLSGEHCLIETRETQFEGPPRSECLNVVSPNSVADIPQTDERKSPSMLSAEGNSSLFYDNSIQEPDFNYLNEVQASNTPVESLLDGQITWDLNIPEVQELSRFTNSPSSPRFVSVPQSAFEMNSSTADVQTVVEEEVDYIKEINDELLSELDNIGDFSVRRLGSGTSEFEKQVDGVEEESLSKHHAEVNKIEHLLDLEESREDINVHEPDVEHISKLQTYQTSRAENVEVSEKEFDENDRGSPYQDASVVETPSKTNEVLPHSLVTHNHEDNIFGMSEMEVQSIENVVVSKKAELTSVETEVMVGVAEVSGQGQVEKETTSGMPELEASSVEDIGLAFKRISSEDRDEKHFISNPPQPQLQNHEDTGYTVPKFEELPIDEVNAVPKESESTSVETEIVDRVASGSCQGQVDTVTTSGIAELEASKVEVIDLAYKQISAEAIEKPPVLEPVDSDADSQMLELEADKTEEIDLAPKQIIFEEIENHVLDPSHAELRNHEDNSDIPELEVQLEEDVHVVHEHTEVACVENEIIKEDANVSSQGQVNADDSFEITEIEGNTVEKTDLAFEQIISELTAKPVDLEPVDAGVPEIETTNVEFKHISSEEITNRDVMELVDPDTTSGMPEIEASSIESINLAFERIGSEETKNCDVLERHRPELVVGETITESFEDTALHRDPIVPVSTNETSVLEVVPNTGDVLDDRQMNESITGIDKLRDSLSITENSEVAVLHRDRSVMASTNVTPIVEAGPNEDAILDDEQLAENTAGTHRLHDSADRTLHVTEFEETQGASPELHVVEAVPSEGKSTALPPNQVLDGETAEKLKLELDDESVIVKAEDKTVPFEEESSIKESRDFEAEMPNHEDEAPMDLQSPSFVKGKGKLSRNSSSSSSSSSSYSSSDSDRE